MAVALLASCWGGGSSDSGDDVATLTYRSACDERNRPASTRAAPTTTSIPTPTAAPGATSLPTKTAVASATRHGIWPPIGAVLSSSPEVTARDFAVQVLGVSEPRLIVCSAQERSAVVRIAPDLAGPASELWLSRVGEAAWEVLGCELEGASLGLRWPRPAERNHVEAYGSGRLEGWTIEALDPATAAVFAVGAVSAGAAPESWQATLDLPPGHPARVVFLVYRPLETLAGTGRRSPAGLAVAYPVG